MNLIFIEFISVQLSHNSKSLCIFSGLISTTKRRLDRERQDEHILEVSSVFIHDSLPL